MKFLVVGLGSMGRRRIRLLQKISKDFHIVGVDSNQQRCNQAQQEFSIQTRSQLDLALEEIRPDGVIVSASPKSHADIIEKCLQKDCHVFTELNLMKDKYESNIALAEEKKKVLFLSSTWLYREELQYINRLIKESKGSVNYNYHVGQYLPDWHPWETIQDYFVGEKETNGCREIFALELPWLIKTFGEIIFYRILSDKNTRLPVQYHDNYLLLVKHASGSKGVLAVDVISRKAVRNLEVYSENLYVTWNGTPLGLKVYDTVEKVEKEISLYENVDKQQEYAAFIVENAYQNELERFIGLIQGKGQAEYTFQEDLKVLDFIDDLEKGVER